MDFPFFEPARVRELCSAGIGNLLTTVLAIGLEMLAVNCGFNGCNLTTSCESVFVSCCSLYLERSTIDWIDSMELPNPDGEASLEISF